MSCCDRRLTRRVALLGLLALAGCGFAPVYGPGGPGHALRGSIRLPAPTDIDSHALNARLEERLGPETAARYDLAHDLRVAVVEQGITPEQVTTRYALNGTLEFTLTEQASGRMVTQGAVSAFTSYSATGSTIATTAAEADARRRLMQMLADQLVARLIATVRDGR